MKKFLDVVISLMVLLSFFFNPISMAKPTKPKDKQKTEERLPGFPQKDYYSCTQLRDNEGVYTMDFNDYSTEQKQEITKYCQDSWFIDIYENSNLYH